MAHYSLVEIAEHIGASIVLKSNNNPQDITITSTATLQAASEGQITFLANSKYVSQLASTQASAVIIDDKSVDSCTVDALVMSNPYLGYALVAQLLDTTPLPADSIHPSAVIDKTVIIGENVSIGANAVIESGVILGDFISIGPGCFIGKNVKIGTGTKLWANVSIYHNVILGDDCLVQSNTVIGSDGFGYAKNKDKWVKIPQVGSVIIGNNVEIGASTTIDRGAIDNTEIHDGVILDNQIQIAHNVIIGENTAIAGCTVVGGSTEIGKNNTIAGAIAINGHIKITDNCYFTGMSMVTKSILKPAVYSSGMPCQENKEWHKMNARIRKLDNMSKRITKLEKQ